LQECEIGVPAVACPVAIYLHFPCLLRAGFCQQLRYLPGQGIRIHLLPYIVYNEYGGYYLYAGREGAALFQAGYGNGCMFVGSQVYVEHFNVELLHAEGIECMQLSAVWLVTLLPEVEGAGNGARFGAGQAAAKEI